MDKKLEIRVRDAIAWAEKDNITDGYPTMTVVISLTDAKRLLYRLKKENAAGNELVYVKDTNHARNGTKV